MVKGERGRKGRTKEEGSRPSFPSSSSSSSPSPPPRSPSLRQREGALGWTAMDVVEEDELRRESRRVSRMLVSEETSVEEMGTRRRPSARVRLPVYRGCRPLHRKARVVKEKRRSETVRLPVGRERPPLDPRARVGRTRVIEEMVGMRLEVRGMKREEETQKRPYEVVAEREGKSEGRGGTSKEGTRRSCSSSSSPPPPSSPLPPSLRRQEVLPTLLRSPGRSRRGGRKEGWIVEETPSPLEPKEERLRAEQRWLPFEDEAV